MLKGGSYCGAVRSILAAAVITLSGCETAPEPTGFDLACAAAAGALRDEKVPIMEEDCIQGRVRGHKDGVDVSVNLRTQRDGSVRVEFHTSGTDQALIHRISRAYDQRMKD